MFSKIVRKGDPEWSPCEDRQEGEELLHDDDLLAFVFKTKNTDSKRAYRWDAWADEDRVAQGGYAETAELAKQYAQHWLEGQGEL